MDGTDVKQGKGGGGQGEPGGGGGVDGCCKAGNAGNRKGNFRARVDGLLSRQVMRVSESES